MLQLSWPHDVQGDLHFLARHRRAQQVGAKVCRDLLVDSIFARCARRSIIWADFVKRVAHLNGQRSLGAVALDVARSLELLGAAVQPARDVVQRLNCRRPHGNVVSVNVVSYVHAVFAAQYLVGLLFADARRHHVVKFPSRFTHQGGGAGQVIWRHSSV